MKIRFTRGAARQIEQALSYVSSDTVSGAARLADRIDAVVDLISRYPEAGQETDRPGVRRAVLGHYPYVLFYRLERGEAIILRFRHAARKPI